MSRKKPEAKIQVVMLRNTHGEKKEDGDRFCPILRKGETVIVGKKFAAFLTWRKKARYLNEAEAKKAAKKGPLTSEDVTGGKAAREK